jgi:hypothetical protein
VSDLKRDEIKYVRDLSKSAYKKNDSCFICGTTENLHFHHFYSMTLLWEKWKKDNGIVINSVEDILKYREQFKDAHEFEIYNETVTLCKFHHMERLHKIYGKVPALSTALKQKSWCEKQRAKFEEK